MMLPRQRRSLFFFLISAASLLFILSRPPQAIDKLNAYVHSSYAKFSYELALRSGLPLALNPSAQCERCTVAADICTKYGSRALQMSRLYDGSGDRARRVLRKAAEGRGLNLAAMGGSVTLGWHLGGPTYHDVVFDWVQKTFPSPLNNHIKAGVGARGSSYFKFCHGTLLPPETDIVLLETAVNDFRMDEAAFNNMELLIRALLDYPSQPLVILTHSFKTDWSSLGTGGDLSLGLANYYDIPAVSTRPLFLPSILREDKLAEQYFMNYTAELPDGTQEQRRDPVHANIFGHRALGDFVIAYLEEQRCRLQHDAQVAPPTLPDAPQILLEANQADGISIPRQRLTVPYDGNIGKVEHPVQPSCITLDDPKRAHLLTPKENVGWDLWTMPHGNGNKRFWRAQKPGDKITFEIETHLGEVTVYALRSRQHNLGIVKCWIDDDTAREHTTMMGGWEDIPYTVGSDFKMKTAPLAPGKHDLHCEAIQHTSNPDPDAHIFLLIGLFVL